MAPVRFVFLSLLVFALGDVWLHGEQPTRSDAGFRVGEFSDPIDVWGAWGAGDVNRPECFAELLPALFERTLTFDELNLSSGALSWIFTGPAGGLTIRLEKDELTLSQRYFDSYGLYAFDPLASEEKAPRYPEKVWDTVSVPLKEPIHSLTVSIDQHLNCTLSGNGVALATMPFLQTLYEHQLKWKGAVGGARGHLVQPDSRAVRVVVNTAEKHQTMIGFGGTTSPLSYRRLSEAGRRHWWSLLAEYNLLVQREYPVGSQLRPDFSNFDRAEDAVPHYYGDTPNDSEISDFDYNRAIKALGGDTWFEFWQLPPWLLHNPSEDEAWGLVDQAPDPEGYADAVVAYCRTSMAKSGFAPAIVGVQNEICQSAESLAKMVPALRRKLDAAGFAQTKIHMANASTASMGLDFAKRHLSAEGVWPLIDFAATNMYDAQDHFQNMDEYLPLLRAFREATQHKDFLAVELCVNAPRFQSDSYRVAFAMAQLFQQNLTAGDARALLYCWLLLHVPEPSFGWTRMLFTIDRMNGSMPVSSSNMLRVFGAFSRRVKRGMVRVGVTSDDPDLLTAAFVGAEQEATLILINRSTSPRAVAIESTAQPFSVIERVDPYHQNAIAAAPAVEIREGNLVVQPGELVTLSSVELGKLPGGFVAP